MRAYTLRWIQRRFNRLQSGRPKNKISWVIKAGVAMNSFVGSDADAVFKREIAKISGSDPEESLRLNKLYTSAMKALEESNQAYRRALGAAYRINRDAAMAKYKNGIRAASVKGRPSSIDGIIKDARQIQKLDMSSVLDDEERKQLNSYIEFAEGENSPVITEAFADLGRQISVFAARLSAMGIETNRLVFIDDRLPERESEKEWVYADTAPEEYFDDELGDYGSDLDQGAEGQSQGDQPEESQQGESNDSNQSGQDQNPDGQNQEERTINLGDFQLSPQQKMGAQPSSPSSSPKGDDGARQPSQSKSSTSPGSRQRQSNGTALPRSEDGVSSGGKANTSSDAGGRDDDKSKTADPAKKVGSATGAHHRNGEEAREGAPKRDGASGSKTGGPIETDPRSDSNQKKDVGEKYESRDSKYDPMAHLKPRGYKQNLQAANYVTEFNDPKTSPTAETRKVFTRIFSSIPEIRPVLPSESYDMELFIPGMLSLDIVAMLTSRKMEIEAQSTISADGKLTIMLMVDNSPSMDEYIKEMLQAIKSIAEGLSRMGVPVVIVVHSNGDPNWCEVYGRPDKNVLDYAKSLAFLCKYEQKETPTGDNTITLTRKIATNCKTVFAIGDSDAVALYNSMVSDRAVNAARTKDGLHPLVIAATNGNSRLRQDILRQSSTKTVYNAKDVYGNVAQITAEKFGEELVCTPVFGIAFKDIQDMLKVSVGVFRRMITNPRMKTKQIEGEISRLMASVKR